MSAQGMTLTVLATGLAEAYAKDEAPEAGGFDISAGMFGPNVSDWLRSLAEDPHYGGGCGKSRLVTGGDTMSAFEQRVSVESRDWPELIELEKNGYQGWVPLFDAELEPIALVPTEKAEVICEVLNRFRYDMPVDYDEKNNPIWEPLPHPFIHASKP